MNQSSEFGSSDRGQIVFPMLVECDRRGRVLWMSRRTRALFRDPQQLIDIIAVKNLPQIPGLEISSLRFWKLCDFPDSVLIGAVGTLSSPDAGVLAPVQVKLSRNFHRLLELERRLFERARRRRDPGAGRRAIHQIEQERLRLGRELHTGVGQMLAAIRWQLEVISGELPEPSESVQRALDSISTLTAQSLEQVRGISKRLHPPEWQRLGLEPAMRQLWEISGIPQRLEAELQIDALPQEPDLEVKVLLYRAFQEALSNLVRHAEASRVEVSLRLREGRLFLTMRDNGVGFDVKQVLAAPPNLAAGIGLRSIRDMAAAAGANFQVDSGPGGTTLSISVAMSSSTT